MRDWITRAYAVVDELEKLDGPWKGRFQEANRRATLRAALAYAARGWHVFPLRPGEKTPAVKDWQGWATTCPDRITAWWTTRPGCGVGIACGPSHLVVVDLDHKPAVGITWRDGWNTLAAGGPMPETVAVRTPSGGFHLYYAAPDPGDSADGPVLRNTASRLGKGIDTRAAGGYVAAPPTRLPHGHYGPAADPDGPLPPLPGWLTERLTTAPSPAETIQL